MLRTNRFRMRHLLPLAAVVVLATAAVACGDDDDDDDVTPDSTPTTAPAGTTTTEPTQAATAPAEDGVTIRVEDNVFTPDDETVEVGTEVTWQWAGELPHSVEGEFEGEDVESEQQVSGTFSFTFESAGTFEYICGVHGQAMSGRIVVE